jgi:hypothetical protein
MHSLHAVLAAIPQVGQGTPPPGSAKFLTILQWGAWSVFGLCVAGVLVSAAKLAHTHSHGGAVGQQQSSLIWTLAACVIAGSASGLVGALA